MSLLITEWRRNTVWKIVSVLLDVYLLCLIIISGISKQKNTSTQLLSINLEMSCLLILKKKSNCFWMLNYSGLCGMNTGIKYLLWQLIRRRQWHPTPVLLPGKSRGRRSLVGCSPWGHEESDMTERLHFHFSLLCIGEGNGNPLQCSCLENPRDGVAQSRTRLKWLSSSSMAVGR